MSNLSSYSQVLQAAEIGIPGAPRVNGDVETAADRLVLATGLLVQFLG